MLLFGRIADVYGKRITFLVGSSMFMAASIICPFMPTDIPFDVFRGLQGISSAASMSSALGILGHTFSPGKYKNYAFAVYGAGAPLGKNFVGSTTIPFSLSVPETSMRFDGVNCQYISFYDWTSVLEHFVTNSFDKHEV